MKQKLITYSFEVPENCIGAVIGEISKRGGELDKQSNKNNKIIFSARVAEKDMLGFEEWFEKISGGKGEFTSKA